MIFYLVHSFSQKTMQEKSFRLNRPDAYLGPQGSRGEDRLGLVRCDLIIPRSDDDRV